MIQMKSLAEMPSIKAFQLICKFEHLVAAICLVIWQDGCRRCWTQTVFFCASQLPGLEF